MPPAAAVERAAQRAVAFVAARSGDGELADDTPGYIDPQPCVIANAASALAASARAVFTAAMCVRALRALQCRAMTRTAAQKMWTSLVVGIIVIAVALFVTAGTLDYWQAWVYLGAVAVTSTLVTLRIVRDPVLVESRLKAGPRAEQRGIQKLILMCTFLPMVAVYIVPGLDHRFGWSTVPAWLCIAGELLIAASMWLVDRVFKENSFGAATVRVIEGQKVITTGPYAFVRNPMYSGAAVYLVGLAFALGSYWTLVPAVLVILGLVWRLFDEEALLVRELQGYEAYCEKVRWHLIPHVF